jgi:hypothetical protein
VFYRISKLVVPSAGSSSGIRRSGLVLFGAGELLTLEVGVLLLMSGMGELLACGIEPGLGRAGVILLAGL